MAVTLTNVETKVRNLIGDNSQSSEDVFEYTTSNVFPLSEPNPISVTDVSVNDVSSSVTYTYNSSTKKVTVSSSLSTGDSVKVQYTSYANFSSTEIQAYVQAALNFLSVFNYYTWEVVNSSVYPEPEPREVNLIAMVTQLIIDPDNKSYRLPDVGVSVPKDRPLHDKIGALVATFKRDCHGVFEII